MYSVTGWDFLEMSNFMETGVNCFRNNWLILVAVAATSYSVPITTDEIFLRNWLYMETEKYSLKCKKMTFSDFEGYTTDESCWEVTFYRNRKLDYFFSVKCSKLLFLILKPAVVPNQCAIYWQGFAKKSMCQVNYFRLLPKIIKLTISYSKGCSISYLQCVA